MNRLTRIHVVTSLAYFLLGSLVGLILAWDPARLWAYGFGGQPRLAHTHLQLVGFVIQMIFGIAYHVLPTLSRGAIHSYPIGFVHYVLTNIGILTLSAGFWFNRNGDLRPLGALLLFAGILLFAYNIWKSMRPRSIEPPVPAVGGKSCQH